MATELSSLGYTLLTSSWGGDKKIAGALSASFLWLTIYNHQAIQCTVEISGKEMQLKQLHEFANWNIRLPDIENRDDITQHRLPWRR